MTLIIYSVSDEPSGGGAGNTEHKYKATLNKVLRQQSKQGGGLRDLDPQKERSL